MADWFYGSVTLIAGLLGLAWSASKLNLSPWPVFLLGATVTPLGALMYLPASRFAINNDGFAYLAWGSAISERWQGIPSGGSLDPIWPGKGIWPSIIAGFHFLIGPVQFLPLVISILAFIACVVVVQLTSEIISRGTYPSLATILVLSSPSLMLFGPSLLRESFVWLGVSLLVLSLIVILRGNVWKSLLSASSGALICLAFRPDVGVVFVYVTAILLIGLKVLTSHSNIWLRFGLFSISTLAIAGSFPFVFRFMQPQVSAERVKAVTTELGEAWRIESAFVAPQGESFVAPQGELGVIGCSESYLLQLGCQALANFPRTFLGPFHWELSWNLISAAAAISTLHFLVLVALSILGFFCLSRDDKLSSSAVWLLAFASMIVWASVLTNYGILIRFRGATEVMLLPSALVGASNFLKWSVGKRSKSHR